MHTVHCLHSFRTVLYLYEVHCGHTVLYMHCLHTDDCL